MINHRFCPPESRRQGEEVPSLILKAPGEVLMCVITSAGSAAARGNHRHDASRATANGVHPGFRLSCEAVVVEGSFKASSKLRASARTALHGRNTGYRALSDGNGCRMCGRLAVQTPMAWHQVHLPAEWTSHGDQLVEVFPVGPRGLS